MQGTRETFPFTKRAIEALPPHDVDCPSRETEYTDMEWARFFDGLFLARPAL
jgi:hypothetical protein